MLGFDLKQEAYRRRTRDRSRVNWEEFVRCQVRANETYYEAKRQFSVINRDDLVNAQSPQWYSIKSLLCSARIRHCTSLLVGVVDCCVCQLLRLICCQIILTASSPGSLLTCNRLAIRLPVYHLTRCGTAGF